MPEENSILFNVNGKPAYRAVREIGRGGSSICYQARKIEPDGTQGRYYVIKQFYPQSLADCLEFQGEDHSVGLKPGCGRYQEELNALRQLFLAEPRLSADVNQTAGGGGGNYPWVFHSERIQGRDDLLLIDTENGYTVDDFVKNQRSSVLSAQYVTLCLAIASRLLESLKGIHRGMLHLDVKPRNVYIVTQDARLNHDSAFCVKLLDLASAVRKDFMRPDEFQKYCYDWNNASFSDGYTDPVMGKLFDAMNSGMVEKFWRKNSVDESVDWYSAAAVLYFMLMGNDGFQAGTSYISLPRTGMLEDAAFRSDLEEVLSRALKIMPYSADEVAEHQFSRDINRLLFLANFASAHGGSGQPAPEPFIQPAPFQEPESSVPGPLQGLLGEAALSPEDQLLAELRHFSDEDRRAYEQQITVLCSGLPESEDQLSDYSCHSIPHIQEVMAEADKLFAALEPWMKVYLPASALPAVRRHLLMAAKYHDIGMAGTPEQRQVLETVDRLYAIADGAGFSADPIRSAQEMLARQAKTADLETGRMKSVLLWRPNGPAALQSLKKACCQYFDEIKKTIRNRHAEISGRYILAHRQEWTDRWGDAFDWAEVALVASLHSNSARDYIDQAALNASLSEAYCVQFLRAYGAPEDASRLCSKTALVRVFLEATLLRLADARRSGKNLRMMDLSPITVERTPGGRYMLCQEKNGVRQPLSFDQSREILLSEACSDFGGVALTGSAQTGFHMTHVFSIRFYCDEYIRSLIRDVRVPSYISELSSALLEPTRTLDHVFQIQAEGISQEEANRWAASFRLPPGYKAVIFGDAPEKGAET